MSASLSPDLIVTDLDRASAFYRAALGFEEVDRVAGPDGAFFAMLTREGVRLMLETPASPDPTTRALLARQGTTPRATLTLYVSTADLDAEERRLKTAGARYHGPVVKPYGMREVSLEDPDGYAWTLGERVAT